MRSFIKLFILVLFPLMFLLGTFVFAAEVEVNFTNPGFEPAGTTIPGFLQQLYLFGIGIGGVAAFGMIVFGGIRFIAGAAVPSEKNQAKEFIWGALWGLVLLLVSYFILKNVNPDLVTLRNPGGEIAKNTQFTACSERTDLPDCRPDQNERENGVCVCKNIVKNAECPKNVEQQQPPKNISDYPYYNWTEESDVFTGMNGLLTSAEIPEVSEGGSGCPRVRLKPGTTPYVITGFENEKFILDIDKLKKRTSLDGEGKVPLPIPSDGTVYVGYMNAVYVKDKPEKALCILEKVGIKKPGGSEIGTINFGIKTKESEKILECGAWKEKENKVEVEVKNAPPGKIGASCSELPSGPCSVSSLTASLQSMCPEFSSYASQLSKICNHESGGIPDLLSGTDWCNGSGCGGPKDKKHSASMGLFQINVTGNSSALPNECKNLYNGVVAGKTACVPKYTSGYSCSYKGTDTQHNACRTALTKSETNMKFACELMRSRKKAGQGIFSDWVLAYRDCNIENVK